MLKWIQNFAAGQRSLRNTKASFEKLNYEKNQAYPVGRPRRCTRLRAAQLARLAISGGRTEQIHTEAIIMNSWELAGLLFFCFAFGWWTLRELD
jgi:hypothetical protein